MYNPIVALHTEEGGEYKEVVCRCGAAYRFPMESKEAHPGVLRHVRAR